MALVKQRTLASQVALVMKRYSIDLRISDAVQRDGWIIKLALVPHALLAPTAQA